MNMRDSDIKFAYNTQNSSDSCEIEAELTVTCININKILSNITIKRAHCSFSGMMSEVTLTILKDMPVTRATAIQTTVTNTMTTTQPISNCKCQAAGSTASIGLGAAVGLLVVLLAVVTTGWMWTCWIMKRQARILITTNSRDIR